MHLISLCCLLIFICNYLCSISYRVSLHFTLRIEYFNWWICDCFSVHFRSQLWRR